MINYSYGSNQTADLDASPYLLNQYDEDWLSDILKQAREEADFIIAFPFWGRAKQHGLHAGAGASGTVSGGQWC